MTPYLAARTPDVNRAFEDELDQDPRFVMLPADARTMSVDEIVHELRIILCHGRSTATAQLLRRFCDKILVCHDMWTRSMEKTYKEFFAELLRDGAPPTADVYRIRQLAVALQSAETVHISAALISQLMFSYVRCWPRFHARHGLW